MYEKRNIGTIWACICFMIVLVIAFNCAIVFAAGEINLSSGSTITSTISTGGTEIWYIINVSSAGSYTIKTSQSGSVEDTIIYLYGHTKSTLLKLHDDISYPSNPYSQITHDLSKNVNYYVKAKFCSYSETGSYKISLTKNSSPSYTTEIVAKKFASMHGAYDTDPFDAKAFAQAMKNNGWAATVTNDNSMWSDTGTLSNMKNSSPNILYWSGHGLPMGSMSYYTNSFDKTVLNGTQRKTDLANTNSDWYKFCNNYYVTYNFVNTPMYDLVGTSWNGSLDWVVLAACNQLTNTDNRTGWSNTMKGSSRKVKGIMGYSSKAPTSGDDTIASNFVNLCFTSSTKRVLFAWLQANGVSSQYTASALYHSINEGDTLTSVTKHTSSTGNNFKYMKMINNTTYETNTSPLSMLSGKKSVMPFALLGTSSMVDEGLLKQTSVEISGEIYEELVLSEPQNESTELENEKFVLNLEDSKSTRVEVERKLKSKNALPDDAKLKNVCTFVSEDLDGNNQKVLGYMFNYGHSVDSIEISTDTNGDYLKVFVDEKGIEFAKKRWSDTKKVQSKKELKNKDIFSEVSGKKKVKEIIKESKNKDMEDDIEISMGKIVYVRSSEEPYKFIPAWEYTLDSGEIIHINYLNGEEIK